MPVPAPPPGSCARAAAGRRRCCRPHTARRHPTAPTGRAEIDRHRRGRSGRCRRSRRVGRVVVGDRPGGCRAADGPQPRPTTRAPTARPRPPRTRERQDLVSAAAAAGVSRVRHHRVARPSTSRRWTSPGARTSAASSPATRAPRRCADADIGAPGGAYACLAETAARPRGPLHVTVGRSWVRVRRRWVGSGQQVDGSRVLLEAWGRSGTTIRLARLWRGCAARPAERLAVAGTEPLTGTAQGTHGRGPVRHDHHEAHDDDPPRERPSPPAARRQPRAGAGRRRRAHPHRAALDGPALRGLGRAHRGQRPARPCGPRRTSAPTPSSST